MVSEYLTTGALIILAVITYIRYKFRYWERKKVYHSTPTLPLGNAGPLFNHSKSFGEVYNEIYADCRSKREQHAGFYFLMTPQYIPVELDLVKNILQKDFQYFVDRGVYYNEKQDPLSANLFSMEGQKWKMLRSKFTPTFTSGKIKMMFPTIVKISQEVVEVIRKSPTKTKIEMKDLMARMTTDIIGNCAFGIDCNSLQNPDAEFSKYGKLIFERQVWEQIVSFFTFLFPSFARLLGIAQLRKDVSRFFMNVIKETIAFREEKQIKRHDFMDLLVQIKNSGKLDGDSRVVNAGELKSLTVEEIAGQAFVFYLGGFETSSTTLSFCLYELALNQSIQDKIRNEVAQILEKHNGIMTYEALNDMIYLDAVVHETLRKYPPLPVLNRVCTKDYLVPNTDVVIEKNTKVIIPVQGIHYDPEFYPDPDVFDPERFSEENRKSRSPFTFLPFGEGPRVCIGLRFGILQTKVGLASLLRNYRFQLNPETPVPLKMNKKKFLNHSESGIFMDVMNV